MRKVYWILSSPATGAAYLTRPWYTSLMMRRRIAFLGQGAKNWVAGTIYIHNLVWALHCLPPAEQPDLHTILGPAQNDKADLELGVLKPKTHYYYFRAHDSLENKIRAAQKSMARFRWPSSLENIALKIKPEAIFPVQGWSLGKNFPVPWVGWIPDFQHKHFPHFFTPLEREERDRTYTTLIRDCGHLVLSSEEARKDLLRWYEAPPEKISVLPFHSVATKAWFTGDPRAAAAAFNLPKHYLMFPSQFWVHKNHITVFKALAHLNKRGIEVHFVSTGFTEDYRRPDHFPMLTQFIKDHGLERQIHILGLIPRQQQINLMRAAAAIVQPSLFEGWSSLVEDCRTLAKPIFVSDIPIHREQKPPDAFFFPPEDSEALADLIAAHWPALTALAQTGREKLAYAAQTTRAQEFARAFLAVISMASL